MEIRVKELERIKRKIEIFKEELMRVGIFTDTYFPQVSGVATSVRVLKEELERLGHTVIIFTTTDPNATMPEWNIVRLGSIPLFSFKERRIAVQGFIEAYKVSQEYELDIIHTQTEFSLGLLGKILGAMLGIPTIHTYHTMYEKYLHYIANGKILRPSHVAYISKNFCNQTRGVIAPSQMTKDKLLSYGVTQEVRVIPTGVEIPKLNPQAAEELREKLGYTKEDKVLLSLSRLSKEKNIAAILDAMPTILENDSTVKCCIVGGGPEKEELEKQVERLGITPYVQFAGEVEHHQVSQYYQMADLYVNASESESQGLTYLEALVNKIPVIAKKNDYLQQFITKPELGMLFERDEDIASSVLTYLECCNQSSHQIEELQNQLLEEISSVTFAKRVEAFYEDAISNYQHDKENTKTWLEKMNFFKIYDDKETEE